MSLPGTFEVSLSVVCGAATTVYKMNDSYYYGAYGSSTAVILFYLDSKWTITVYDNRDGCEGTRNYEQNSPDPNPIGDYDQIGGSGEAVVA